jgi:hypothetical protein
MLLLLIPLIWLTVTAFVVAVCRVAASGTHDSRRNSGYRLS